MLYEELADRERTLLNEVRDDPDPADLLSGPTLYQRLSACSVLIQPEGIGENPYDAQANRGVDLLNYENPAPATYRVQAQLAIPFNGIPS